MVETIVDALLGGLAAASGKVVPKAVEDAYGGLKGMIAGRLAGRAGAGEAVAALEAKPDSAARRAVVVEELEEAGAGGDAELIEAARRLLAALGQAPAGGSNVQNAHGFGIAQAAGGSRADVTIGR